MAEGVEPPSDRATLRQCRSRSQPAPISALFWPKQSAADTEYDWDWYGGLVGAYFDSHPAPQTAAVQVTASHPVVEGFPDQIERFDEWYDFRAPPGANVTVLAFVDESTYEGGAMGSNHPIVWAHEYEGGRAVYVGFGHTAESFEEPLVLTLLDNAIRWAGGLERLGRGD